MFYLVKIRLSTGKSFDSSLPHPFGEKSLYSSYVVIFSGPKRTKQKSCADKTFYSTIVFVGNEGLSFTTIVPLVLISTITLVLLVFVLKDSTRNFEEHRRIGSIRWCYVHDTSQGKMSTPVTLSRSWPGLGVPCQPWRISPPLGSVVSRTGVARGPLAPSDSHAVSVPRLRYRDRNDKFDCPIHARIHVLSHKDDYVVISFYLRLIIFFSIRH